MQRVKVKNSFSDWHSVISGIPQGSVLGPLLFVIFINDLPCEIIQEFVYILLFADDAKLFRHVQSRGDCVMLQQAVSAFQTWSDIWLLSLNILKCSVLSVGRDTAIQNEYYLLKDSIILYIKHLSHVNDLGVEIDEKLNFKLHIQNKINKASSILGVIRRNFGDLTPEYFIIIYKTMVRSILEYNNSVWCPYTKENIHEIEKVQKWATKIPKICNGKSYIERLKLLSLPTLRYRRLRGDMIETYKIIHGFYDTAVAPILKLNSTLHTRGNSLKLTTNRTRYDLRKHFFTNRVINAWNSLPDDVVTANTINTFKNRLDKHWINQACIYDYNARLTGAGSGQVEIDIEF